MVNQRLPEVFDESPDSSYLSSCKREHHFGHISERIYDLVNWVTMVLESRSLTHCAVPKVATKTLLNAMLYMHVQDIIDNLDRNGTYIGADRAEWEKDTNIILFTNELRQKGIVISKTEEPKSLSAFLRMYLKVLRFGNINGTYYSRSLNPWRLSFMFSFPYFRLRSLPNFSDIFSPSYTRAIFVRHPFERLASAYKERIATLRQDRIEPEPVYDKIREEICRSLPPKQRSCKGTIPSFEDFIEYILIGTNTSTGIAKMDYHWQPYSLICQVCKFKYNFIGKYEMLNDDFNSFRKIANLSDWNLEKRNGASGLSTYDYQKFYSTLPDDLICQLIHLYDQDFRLFNYRVDDYINRPTLLENCNQLKTL
ncbi:unnamed protein product [Adineta steineri]|uniref:Carbohydrate sulfotransferase n=1 Tax=Adineta steineri TaxID=433720 RepID=A0A818LAC3_9BILA|nr:unnamed protein product [Adineta steineri]CAF3565417.1 unnamed protein product [Adineta steineri]